MAKQHAAATLEARIATVVAVTLILHSPDLDAAAKQLRHITAGQSDYFEHELAVIDLALSPDDLAALDWSGLLGLLREWNLNPVAVRNAPADLHPMLHGMGLSIDEVVERAKTAAPAVSTEPVPAAAAAPAPKPASRAERAPARATPDPASPPGAPCMIIDTPVRGGQRIYARGADLVVTAVVNAGAELIADGSIHVYAPLRGRALAGAAGATGARIFALEMSPELVSIAGIYRTFDEGAPAGVTGGACEVRLVGDRLDMRAIGKR